MSEQKSYLMDAFNNEKLGSPLSPNFIPPQPDYSTVGPGGEHPGAGQGIYQGGPPPAYGYGCIDHKMGSLPSDCGKAANMKLCGNVFGDRFMKGGNKLDFTDETKKNGFIRKVFAIIFLQLTTTFGLVAPVVFHGGIYFFVMTHRVLWWTSLAIMWVCLVTITRCGERRRKAPMDFICLGLFTLAGSFFLGCTFPTFYCQQAMLGIGSSAIVALGLTLFTFQTKIEFTMLSGGRTAATLILIIFGITSIFWRGRITSMTYASFGAFIFCLCIIYGIQIMLDGNYKYDISPEEYTFAALNLYLDILSLFINILIVIVEPALNKTYKKDSSEENKGNEM